MIVDGGEVEKTAEGNFLRMSLVIAGDPGGDAVLERSLHSWGPEFSGEFAGDLPSHKFVGDKDFGDFSVLVAGVFGDR